MDTCKKGKRGEKNAENYLIGKGYIFVARNYRRLPGEIDLIFTDERDLVFVEVKAWKNLSELDLEYSINRKKQGRIIETSKIFLSENEDRFKNFNVRYDIVYIDKNIESITHYKDVIGEF